MAVIIVTGGSYVSDQAGPLIQHRFILNVYTHIVGSKYMPDSDSVTAGGQHVESGAPRRRRPGDCRRR